MSKVTVLPPHIGSLAHGLPPAAPGTLFVLGKNGMSVAPDANFSLVFGRNMADAHVCVGGDDRHVSRQHGYITREGSRWVLTNIGRQPIRFPGSRLVLNGQRAELPVAYTPLFIVAPRREHLLEVRVATRQPADGTDIHTADTLAAAEELSDVERLVLVCLSQRYLRQEAQPQPLTWTAVAEELNALQPDKGWNWRRAARVVEGVRMRLSTRAHRPVPGLTEEEIPPPVGNMINHNLITHLLVTGTLVPSALRLLDGPLD